MQCNRCGGLMVRDQLTDPTGMSGHMRVPGVRCLNCGELRDSLVDRNRISLGLDMSQTLGTVVKKSKRVLT